MQRGKNQIVLINLKASKHHVKRQTYIGRIAILSYYKGHSNCIIYYGDSNGKFMKSHVPSSSISIKGSILLWQGL